MTKHVFMCLGMSRQYLNNIWTYLWDANGFVNGILHLLDHNDQNEVKHDSLYM